MDRGAWWATAHGVTRRQAQLSARMHTHMHTQSMCPFSQGFTHSQSRDGTGSHPAAGVQVECSQHPNPRTANTHPGRAQPESPRHSGARQASFLLSKMLHVKLTSHAALNRQAISPSICLRSRAFKEITLFEF